MKSSPWGHRAGGHRAGSIQTASPPRPQEMTAGLALSRSLSKTTACKTRETGSETNVRRGAWVCAQAGECGAAGVCSGTRVHAGVKVCTQLCAGVGNGGPV